MEYAPVMVGPAMMMPPPAKPVAPKPKPQPKPQPKPSPPPREVKIEDAFDPFWVTGKSETTKEMTTAQKLGWTAVLVLGMGTWVWGASKFHKCGSGWVVAFLKQFGVSVAVGLGYFLTVLMIVSTIHIWSERTANNTSNVVLEPLNYSLTTTALLIAASLLIFRDKCRL